MEALVFFQKGCHVRDEIGPDEGRKVFLCLQCPAAFISNGQAADVWIQQCLLVNLDIDPETKWQADSFPIRHSQRPRKNFSFEHISSSSLYYPRTTPQQLP